MEDNTQRTTDNKGDLMYSVQITEDKNGNPADLNIVYTDPAVDRLCFTGLLDHFAQRLAPISTAARTRQGSRSGTPLD